jgi:hypothetical protein
VQSVKGKWLRRIAIGIGDIFVSGLVVDSSDVFRCSYRDRMAVSIRDGPTSISAMGSNPGRSYKLILLPSLWIMLKRFGTARAPTRSGSCEAASLGSFLIDEDQKLREMKWAIFLFHSYGYRLERRSMIRGCAGGHRKSRRTAGAIHKRNICGRLQTITFVWGRFRATNIGEVVLIGTHGTQLIIASGAIRRQGFPNFVRHGVSRLTRQ